MKSMQTQLFLTLAVALALSPAVFAHDTWLQTNTAHVPTGEVVHVDLMLGNHGNDHRDFKLSSKITLAPCTLSVVEPDGQATDLKQQVVDNGFGEKEGYWTARHVTRQPGLHSAVHSLDLLHGPVRAVKSSKAFFRAGEETGTGMAMEPVGLPIELVPLTDPTLAAAGKPVRVQVIHKGSPLPDARVTFIPRGQVLAEGFDDNFERTTDSQGIASFTPDEGNYYLIVVHHVAPDEKGEGYEKTHYGATMTVLVSQIDRTVTGAP